MDKKGIIVLETEIRTFVSANLTLSWRKLCVRSFYTRNRFRESQFLWREACWPETLSETHSDKYSIVLVPWGSAET